MAEKQGSRRSARLYETPAELLRSLVESGQTDERSIHVILDSLVRLPSVQEAVDMRRQTNSLKCIKTEPVDKLTPLTHQSVLDEELFPEVCLDDDEEHAEEQLASCAGPQITRVWVEELFPELTLESEDDEAIPDDQQHGTPSAPPLKTDSITSEEEFHLAFTRSRDTCYENQDSPPVVETRPSEIAIQIDSDARSREVLPQQTELSMITEMSESILVSLGVLCGMITAAALLGE